MFPVPNRVGQALPYSDLLFYETEASLDARGQLHSFVP